MPTFAEIWRNREKLGKVTYISNRDNLQLAFFASACSFLCALKIFPVVALIVYVQCYLFS